MPLEHFALPPAQKNGPLRSSFGQADLTTQNPRTSRIHENIRGLMWSTRPDSNWHSLRGLRPLILAARSSLAAPPSVGNALKRKAPGTKPTSSFSTKKPAPLCGTGSIVNGARDQIRTGDPHVGNVMLYQLSYSCLIPVSESRPSLSRRGRDETRNPSRGYWYYPAGNSV